MARAENTKRISCVLVIGVLLALASVACSAAGHDATGEGRSVTGPNGSSAPTIASDDGFPTEYHCVDSELPTNLGLADLEAATDNIRAVLRRTAPDAERFVPRASEIMRIETRIGETAPGGQAAFAKAACQSLTALAQSAVTPLSYRPLKLDLTGSVLVYGYRNFCVFDRSEMEYPDAAVPTATVPQDIRERIESEYDASTPDGYRNQQLFVDQAMFGAYMAPARAAAFQYLCPQLGRTTPSASLTPAEMRTKLNDLSDPPQGACGPVELATPIGPLNGYLNVDGTPIQGLVQSGAPSCELALEIFAKAGPKETRANGLDIAGDFWQCTVEEDTPRIVQCSNANGYSWLTWETFAL